MRKNIFSEFIENMVNNKHSFKKRFLCKKYIILIIYIGI